MILYQNPKKGLKYLLNSRFVYQEKPSGDDDAAAKKKQREEYEKMEEEIKKLKEKGEVTDYSNPEQEAREAEKARKEAEARAKRKAEREKREAEERKRSGAEAKRDMDRLLGKSEKGGEKALDEMLSGGEAEKKAEERARKIEAYLNTANEKTLVKVVKDIKKLASSLAKMETQEEINDVLKKQFGNLADKVRRVTPMASEKVIAIDIVTNVFVPLVARDPKKKAILMEELMKA